MAVRLMPFERPLFWICGLPIGGVAIGCWLNATIVPGQYEIMGLVRILLELAGRSGFWCVALMVWLAGLNVREWSGSPSFERRRNLLLLWGAIAAVFLTLALRSSPIVPTGSVFDLLALVLLASGLIAVGIFVSGGVATVLARSVKLAGVVTGVFVLYGFVAYFHTMVKGSLFVLMAPSDQALWSLDTLIMGRDYYSNLQIWRTDHPAVVRWLDVVYVGLLQQVAWSGLFFVGGNDGYGARRYLLSMILIYLLGPVVYFLGPSWGPVYFAPDQFSDLRLYAPDTWHLVNFLLDGTTKTMESIPREIAPFGYVAAMPSLHVGIAVLMLIAMRRSKPMIIFNLGLLLLTVVATNVLGWHYLSDIAVGAVLGVMSWRLACVILPDPVTDYPNVPASFR